MQQLSTWEQSGMFDPTNPNQIAYERYTGIPGGYGSFYFNKVPTKTQLFGLSGAGFLSLPVWAQALLVAGSAGVVGFVGTRIVRKRLAR